MKYELLLSRINERLKALRLSERKACMKAGVGENTIRNLKPGKEHAPKPENLAKLASVLGVPASYFLEAAALAEDQSSKATLVPVMMETVFVRGAVQAGVWREALEWEAVDWIPMAMPMDARFPGIQRFALIVKGSSMDRVYPDGTIVVVIRFGDLARDPRHGERVVVLRRMKGTTEYEATLKEYEVDQHGRHILWPRSRDPEHQTPIILPEPDLPLIGGDKTLPPTVFPVETEQHGEPDLVISALVVGSYQPEASVN